MFDAISILVEVIVHLYNNEYFGYFAIESKQEEFHAYHGYCLQQMLMLHDDEWCRFCELGGLTKKYRGSITWNDPHSLSSLASELSEKSKKIVQFTSYRCPKNSFISGRSKLMMTLGPSLPRSNCFFY